MRDRRGSTAGRFAIFPGIFDGHCAIQWRCPRNANHRALLMAEGIEFRILVVLIFEQAMVRVMNKRAIVFSGLVIGMFSGAALSQDMVVFPAGGQSKEQQSKDEYECYGWAKNQSGFDPMAVTAPRLVLR